MMQTVDHTGKLGPVQEFTMENVRKAAQDPNVDHIDVFEGTAENIERRQALVGKKYSVSKSFRKTGGNRKR